MIIRKIAPEKAERYAITVLAPGYSYDHERPEVQLCYDNKAFYVRFTVYESDPVRTKTKHFEPVNLDSCVEFFVNFTPDQADRYINFEVNANGIMNASFRKDRYIETPLTKEDVEGLNITPRLYEDHWTVEYTIPFTFVQKYYPAFDIEKKPVMKANFYKCGDETEQEHYLTFFPVPTPEPDFHRPEYFGELVIE